MHNFTGVSSTTSKFRKKLITSSKKTTKQMEGRTKGETGTIL